MQKILYTDISLGFEKHPVTKKLKTVSNEEAITQALKILVLTNQYEKLFKPDYYTDVEATLFENINSGTLIILKEKIQNAIRNYEPRAEVIDVQVNSIFDDNELRVTITYLPIIGLDPITITVFLERNR